MAARDELIATLTEAVARIAERMAALESGPVIRDPTAEELRALADEWLAANVRQPVDGAAGTNGRDAEPVSDEAIEQAVQIWMRANRARLIGAPGRPGRDGAPGERGTAGIPGPRGESGADGVGIAEITQPRPGEMLVTLTDGREYTLRLPRGLSGGGGGSRIQVYVDDAPGVIRYNQMEAYPGLYLQSVEVAA